MSEIEFVHIKATIIWLKIVQQRSQLPDWKVCKMRRGVLPARYMNASRVSKMPGGEIPRTEQTFQSGSVAQYKLSSLVFTEFNCLHVHCTPMGEFLSAAFVDP